MNEPKDTILLPAQQVPVRYRVDVLVVGGGTSGASAAVAAARQGARTLLVEKNGFLGGTAVGGPVPMLQEGPLVRGEPVIRGIYAETKARLAKYGAIYGETAGIELRKSNAIRAGFFDPQMLQVVYFDMCEEAGVQVLLHTYLIQVVVAEGSLKQAIFVNKGGLMAVEAQQFVDATGDGDLATAAGARFEIGRPSDGLTQAPTVVFDLSNIDQEQLKTADWKALWPVFRAECPEVTVARGKISFRHLSNAGHIQFMMCRRPGVNAVDPEDKTRAEISGRRQARAVMGFFRRHVPGAENCVVAMMSAEIGVRSLAGSPAST